MDVDQRKEWWTRFIKQIEIIPEGKEDLSAERASVIVEKLDKLDLRNFSSSPLTNYLLSQIYLLNTDVENRNFSDSYFYNLSSRNKIYKEMLEQIYKRYGNDTPFNEEEFLVIIQAIATVTWFDHGASVSRKKIIKQCEQDGSLAPDILRSLSAGDGLLRLVSKFYFKNIAGDRNQFEFTHRSFYEYLVAKKIISLLDEITDLKIKQALKKWVLFFSANEIDIDIYQFIVEIINETDEAVVKRWQSRLSELLTDVIAKGVCISMLSQIGIEDTVPEAIKYANNSETSLLILHAACSEKTGVSSAITIPDEYHDTVKSNIFGIWWRRVSTYTSPKKEDIIRKSLKSLKINKSNLNLIDFYFCDLSNSTFIDCEFSHAILKNTLFNNATFKECTFPSALLQDAEMEGVRFDQSNLNTASFKEADLSKATFIIDKKIIDVNFSGAILNKVIFENLTLENVCFDNAEMWRAKLTNTTLSNVTLLKANLSQAKLQGCDLSNIEFDYETVFDEIEFDNNTIFPDGIEDHEDFESFICTDEKNLEIDAN